MKWCGITLDLALLSKILIAHLFTHSFLSRTSSFYQLLSFYSFFLLIIGLLSSSSLLVQIVCLKYVYWGGCRLNEEMIETLFIVNTSNSKSKETTPRLVGHSPSHENRVLDPKKSQNIAISLRALNVTTEEVCDALLEGIHSRL